MGHFLCHEAGWLHGRLEFGKHVYLGLDGLDTTAGMIVPTYSHAAMNRGWF
jgi:hypothetical protein